MSTFSSFLSTNFCFYVTIRIAFENGRANLCLTDQRELKKLDMGKIADCGVYIVQALYLRNVVLTTEGMSKPKWTDAVFPDFKPFLDRMSVERENLRPNT